MALRIELPIMTYVLVTIGLIFLFAAFLVFCCVKGLHSNSNSIHINMVFVMFATLIIFLIGIDKATQEVSVYKVYFKKQMQTVSRNVSKLNTFSLTYS